MTWDALGNRVGLTVPSGSYSFVYDITAGVPAVLEEDRPGGFVVQYFRTPDGALIASRASTTGEPTRYYHFDGLGSTICLTNSSGVVTDSYSYDPYGNVISHSGSTEDNPYQYVGALGYYTHYQDPEIRLLQLGYRFYDPTTGRFTQQDPIGDGLNWYEYCGGNPFGGVDPWGLAVSDLGFGESLIPVWGSGRAAVHDFQNGDWLNGIGNAALAATDVFLVKSAITGIGKLGAKGAMIAGESWTWNAVRKRIGRRGLARAWEPVHHYFIGQGGRGSRILKPLLGDERFRKLIHQPWNWKPVGKQWIHNAIEGKGGYGWSFLKRHWAGSPDWFHGALTGLAAYLGGRGVMQLGLEREGCQ